MKRLVLASSSPWRLAMLRDAGLPCVARTSDVDESRVFADDPTGLAVSRARAKALAVAALEPAALVIGADQVAHLEGEAFGKPTDAADWRARLRALRGRTHALTTGVALVEGAEVEVFSETSLVQLRADLSDAELDAYITWGEAAGCAGGYQVERRGAWLIEQIVGDYANVIGLPLFPLLTRLRARGWRMTDVVG